MVWIEGTLWCDGCGVEITWVPVEFANEQYCCQSCMEGEECNCGAKLEDSDRREEPTKDSRQLYS